MSGYENENGMNTKTYSGYSSYPKSSYLTPLKTDNIGKVLPKSEFLINDLTSGQKAAGNGLSTSQLQAPPTVEGLAMSFSDDTPWYKDGSALQGYAGLASSAMQLYAMPQQMRLAKLQEKSMEQNLSRAKADSATRDAMIANLNNYKTSKGGG